MIAPRRIVVRVQSTIACRAVVDAGEEFAQLFGVPVHGYVVEDRIVSEICTLPAAFLPRGLAARTGTVARQAMRAALSEEMRRLKDEMAHLSARQSSVADNATTGDLIVTSIDLSEPSLGPAMRAAAAVCPPEGGVLMVPERHPCRTGPIVVLARDAKDRGLAVGRRIAGAIACDLIVVQSTDEDLPAEAAHRIELPTGRCLTSSMIHADAARLIIVSKGVLDRLELDLPESPMHRLRASLLLIGDR